ncbi:MAG: HNH endonuclease, partial [Bacteroidales bacterium]|nr:HNH endonuclease [Bacteroidales bacterium]
VAGRTVLSKALKKALIEKYGAKCFIYLQTMEERLLQVDHRIPYEIGGEQDESNIECYMLLSPSANRAKSWTCEHCPNWGKKDPDFCVKCFWAHPEEYSHIAGKEQRQIIITFTGDEIEDYNKLIALVGIEKAEDTIKEIINQQLA